FFADLERAYGARAKGGEVAWEPLPVQYAHYALWQQELLGAGGAAGGVVSRGLAYWEGVLEGLPQELELPVDRPRPVRPSYRGGVVRAGVGAGVHRALAGVARGAGASVLMVAQAAVAVAWSRAGAGVEVPVGTVVAGRGDEVLDEVVGFFVNTLVLRTDVSGDPSFGELLERVREADLGAFAHQEVPFEYRVRELNPARVVGRHLLVQTMLSMDGDSSATLSLPGLRCTPVEGAGERVAKFDLDV
ncbi:condensation domain-containing protein, partial [Streptomyces sp. NEAU-H3]|uniref:condensation domain-containing protein n=1 Tax=Streptomyces sp. NEAU-H3 TaxID=2720636 RepID=UPI0016AF8D68